MRQESRQVATAFLAGVPHRVKSTQTDGKSLTYHGNTIAWHNPDKSISFTMAGWGTITTRERLNAIHELAFGYRPFHQMDGAQYYNESLISDRMVITMHHILEQAA